MGVREVVVLVGAILLACLVMLVISDWIKEEIQR